MISEELYEKYKGLIVTSRTGHFGEVIGFYNGHSASAANILIGIKNGKQGWERESRLIHEAEIPSGVNGAHSFYFITADEIINAEPPSIEKKPTVSIDNLIEKEAENWLKKQENYKSLGEDEANLLLNGFIQGAAWYSNSTKRNRF